MLCDVAEDVMKISSDRCQQDLVSVSEPSWVFGTAWEAALNFLECFSAARQVGFLKNQFKDSHPTVRKGVCMQNTSWV